MSIEDLTTIDQVTAFLEGTQRVLFEISKDKDLRYQWVQRTLVKFHYLSLSRPDKGVLIRYLMKISGYSRQQLTRLIKQYRDTGRLVRRQSTVNGFARRFTAEDIRLLAAMDERHNTPNGLTMKKLCERAYTVYGQAKYQHLRGAPVQPEEGHRLCSLPPPCREDPPQKFPHQKLRAEFTKSRSRQTNDN